MEVVDARDAALRRLFDDASALDPTGVPLDEALRRHRGGSDSGRGWLVRRLRIHASAAPALVELLDDDDDLEVAVHCDRRAGTSFADGVAADVAAAGRLDGDPRVRVSCLAATLPGEAPDAELDALLTAVAGAGLAHALILAVEVPVAGRSAGEVLRTLKAVEVARDTAPPGVRPTPTVSCADHVPGPLPADLELAGLLLACADAQLPVSVAGGLDHPTRRPPEQDAPTGPHGLLNVIGAAAVAHHGGRLDAIEACLATPAAGVRIGSGALVIGDQMVDTEQLRRTRASFLLSVCTADLAEVVTQLAVTGALTATGALR